MNQGKYSSAVETSYSLAAGAEIAAPFVSRPLEDTDFIEGSHSLWPQITIVSPSDASTVTTAARGDDDVMGTAPGTTYL